MFTLDTKIQYLKGVGPASAQRLADLGIYNIRDLLHYYPRDYLYFSNFTPINRLRIGETAVIHAEIKKIANIRSAKKRMFLTKAQVGDLADSNKTDSTIDITWFNQPFLVKNLRVGSVWYFLGKVGYDFQARKKVLLSPIYEKKPEILPIYPLTAGITSKYLRTLASHLLQNKNLFTDYIPESIKSDHDLIDLYSALQEIHFPTSKKNLQQAIKRLSFDELLKIILLLTLSRAAINQNNAPAIAVNKQLLINFVKSLQFTLTNAQRLTSWEIINDLTKSKPMNRLLEGDVGSGKTVVALMAALNVIKAGCKVLWMAPTEILAHQHYQTACKLFKDFDVQIGLITSKNKQSNSKKPTEDSLVIGTHALIQKNMQFTDVGLIIIDEQHRFGVKQRSELVARGSTQIKKRKHAESIPHFLSMTATPIPRTLALTIYSDLDLSIINEMPKNRQKIITKLVDPTNRDKAYEFIKKQINTGRQVFVICPLIDIQTKSKTKLFDLDRKSVKAEYDKLSKKIFPKFNIAMLHGKMKAEEKEAIMADFGANKINILVATSVIEVGIDIPNATIMLIEDADRFGLAQLHQFRGRVGRGEHQSYCLLFSNSLSPNSKQRLEKLVKCSDGFKLAEEDLKMRGPGELVGTDQSGIIDLKLAKLTDIITINQVKQSVQAIMNAGIDKFPLLQEELRNFKNSHHLE